MVELKEPLTTLWRGKDAFEEVKTLQGEVFRDGIGVLLLKRS